MTIEGLRNAIERLGESFDREYSAIKDAKRSLLLLFSWRYNRPPADVVAERVERICQEIEQRRPRMQALSNAEKKLQLRLIAAEKQTL